MGRGFRNTTLRCSAAVYLIARCWSIIDRSRHVSWHFDLAMALSISLCTAFIWNAVLRPKYFSELRHFPQPSVRQACIWQHIKQQADAHAQDGTFFHGHLWRILSEWPGLPMRDWINSVPNDGVIRCTTIFNNERLIPTSPQALAEVLVTRSYDWDKPKAMREVLGNLIGFGVLLSSGAEHKAQRKALAPAFSYRHLKNTYPVFWSQACHLVELVQSEKQLKVGVPTSISWAIWLNKATLDIISLVSLSRSFGALNDHDNVLLTAYRQLFATDASPSVEAALETLQSLLPVSLLTKLPLARNRIIKSNVSTVHGIMEGLVRERLQQKRFSSMGSSTDILDVAMNSGQFDSTQLVDQLMTMFAAGHETTATATSWALYTLCKWPQVQERLRNEVLKELPLYMGDIKASLAELVDHAEYLNAVCNEVLRLYPPVPLTRRTSCRDTVLLGYHIPKNSDILLVPAAVNASKELWGDDALHFKPERWLGLGRSNNGGAKSNFANLTFLHGPRSCIGQSFAKAEMMCLLAVLVSHFRFEFIDGEDVALEIQSGFLWKIKGSHNLQSTLLHVSKV